MNRQIAPDTLKEDLDILPAAYALDILQPLVNDKKKISYAYAISSKDIEWLNIVYNEDVILRYKLNIRKKENDWILQWRKRSTMMSLLLEKNGTLHS